MTDHILIVGGSSGMGLAAAKRFLSGGWRVTIAGRKKDRLEAAKAELGDVEGLVMDATNATTTGEALRSLSGLTAIATTAGSEAVAAPFMEAGADGIVETFKVKAGAVLTLLEATHRAGVGHTSYTFVSGAAARKGTPGMAPIVSVNAALEALVPVLAKELAPLRVNVVSPGFVDTSIYDAMPDADRRRLVSEIAAGTPTGRVVTAEDVAEAIWFAVTNASVNGAIIPIDGGI